MLYYLVFIFFFSMYSRQLFVGFSLFLLTGCLPTRSNSNITTDQGENRSESAVIVSSSSASSMVMDDTNMEDAQVDDDLVRTMYSHYAPSVLMDGQTKVLFFHASWCPTCRKADATLKGIYNQFDGVDMPFEELVQKLPAYSTYMVDYDTEKELRAQYGVTYQHTFVLVDAEGKVLKVVQGPTDAALKVLIGAQ